MKNHSKQFMMGDYTIETIMEPEVSKKITKFTLFSKLHGIKNNPWVSLWINQLLQYTIIFGIIIISGIFVVTWYNIVPLNTEQAQSLLGVLVQTQAAVASIVVSLTLVAIQLAAGSYTPRVIDVMKKSPDMWLLLFIYVVSISIGFIAFILIGTINLHLISLILILGFYTFAILFLYFFNTIKHLRPDDVVKMLVGDINAGNIHQTEWTDDIFQPIFDVIHSSINKYDVTTTRIGLNLLFERVLGFYPRLDDVAKNHITTHLCEHIQRSSIIALGNEDEGTIQEIVTILEKATISIIDSKDLTLLSHGCERQYQIKYMDPLWVLEYIGTHATDKGLESAAAFTTVALQNIGLHAADFIVHAEKISPTFGDPEGVNAIIEKVVQVLCSIGMHATDKKLEDVVGHTSLALQNVGIKIADKKLQHQTVSVICTLGAIGKRSAECKLKHATFQVAWHLSPVGKLAVDNKMSAAPINVINNYERIIWGSIENGWDDSAEQIQTTFFNEFAWNVIDNCSDANRHFLVESILRINKHAKAKHLKETTKVTNALLAKISRQNPDSGEAFSSLSQLF